MLIDTHCHISDSAFDTDRAEALERAKAAGLDWMLTVGTEPANWSEYLRDATQQSDPRIYAALGFHPNHAQSFSPSALDELRTLAQKHRGVVLAIGETGLDFFRDNCPEEIQRVAFDAQLQLAEELGLPFILHCRQAERAMLDVLKAHREKSGKPLRGVWHCFTASVEFLREAVELDLYFGFGGVLTYPKADEVRAAAKEAPRDRILLETDAPYLAPKSRRGKRNEPALVAETGQKMAEVLELSFPEVCTLTSDNAKRLFMR